jgi:hypothetical protein
MVGLDNRATLAAVTDEMPGSRQVISPGSVPSGERVGAPSMSSVATREWLIGGYAQALARLTESAYRMDPDARHTFWPMFETLNWSTSVEDYLHDKGEHLDDPIARGLRFVRNRVHHAWAAALDLRIREISTTVHFPGGEPGTLNGQFLDWFWKPTSQIPPGGNRNGEAEYAAELADNPVLDSLDAFARLLGVEV